MINPLSFINPGVANMAAAAFLFSVGVALIKIGGRNYPVMEMMFIRSVVGFLYCWLLIRRAGVSMLGVNRKLLVLRGLVGFVALYFTFWTFTLLPLADGTVILFLNPIMVVLLAAVFLKESMGRGTGLSIAISLAGVLMVVKPDFIFGSGHDIAPLGFAVALGAAFTTAVALVIIRKAAMTEHPGVVIIYPILMVLAGAPVAGFISGDWIMPHGMDWLVLIGIGVVMNLGQHFMTRGYSREKAGVVSAVGYTEVAWAALFGAMFFGELPDNWTWAGAALIIGGAFVLGRRKGKS